MSMVYVTQFNEAVELVFDRIVDTLDASDANCDVEVNQSVLEITCGDDSKIIVNRHEPNREIWVAAKSGGFHFKWKDGDWIDTRSGEQLSVALSRVVREQTGVALKF
jgi:CyaY protein